jgi:hypothetical protein
MPRGLQVSCSLVANTMLFVKASDFVKWEIIYIVTMSIAHWDIWGDSYCGQVFKERYDLGILTASVMCLHLRMQEEDTILEQTNAKYHLCTH